ncbi:MAG: PIG-L family deacetylase [Bacteroidetes bacterium]|nr:PIG-L family deacetylase [Bacteroidota bacterium]
MLDIQGKNILILAPHTDDAEFGCGGTISKLVEQKNNVYCAAFSACQQSVLKEFPSDILITEVKEATKELGVPEKNLILFDYEVRTFNFRRQELLDDILKLKKDIAPDFVFMPSVNDVHQDHYTIAQEGLRAFKFSNIMCYELPWNNLSFNTAGFCVLDEKHIQQKINSILKYKSQAHRNYANADFIKSLARIRGTQINSMYAECFEILRLKI